ncbi:MAG TPA: polyhydroxyalkanoate synthesis repressor PhaR [Acidobacteriota bacterium]
MPRIIKKYANRRLYDTQISQYITLDDLKKLIVSGIAVQIVDANSKKDISREVLLQLVSEQESLGQPILNEAILTALIRFYDHPMQKLASRYLEMALNLLHQQRSQLSKRMQKLMRSPAQMVSDLTRQNAEWMSELQQTFMSAMSPSKSDEEESSDD